MFERYTEKARRVIFFARYEASQFGSPHIDTQHLLLGLGREDKGLFKLLNLSVEDVRNDVEKVTKIEEKTAVSVDLPLSDAAKLVLAYGADEAERLNHTNIGTADLFLGLLREEGSLAAKILQKNRIDLDATRKIVAALDCGQKGRRLIQKGMDLTREGRALLQEGKSLTQREPATQAESAGHLMLYMVSPNSEAILNAAQNAAGNNNPIDDIHLLVALLENGATVKMFEKYGLNSVEMRAAVVNEALRPGQMRAPEAGSQSPA